ncbi:MAG: winged helix-turn-helix domain-containing protein [Candidatus Eremiobacteraeota bacterium]|nr:winged helix-turn-helix domain-containing protein [Candidatus Eremiobacteraeota bacterium]
MRSRVAISASEARRVALAAQGFGGAQPASAGRSSALKTIKQLGLLQIDSVNVLVRSHYLPLFSRIGAYDRMLLGSLAYGRRRELFEYWAHEASLLPLATFPLLRWRMRRAHDGVGIYRSLAEFARDNRKIITKVEREIRERGAMAASDFNGERGKGGWWGWSTTKHALEYLFWSGALTTQTRRNSFERVYDLTERVIPEDILSLLKPSSAEAQRELLMIAARAFGVATESDLRDYFRLDASENKLRLAELLEDRRLLAVTVEGWKQQVYLHPECRIPRKIETSALLSPFDSLVWNRPRIARLFDFDYRLEIYTPAHKRVHGYYVLPYLLDERLVARIDAKADRAAGTLIVHAVHLETGVRSSDVMPRLRDDLDRMSQWLGLERVRLPARPVRR